MNQEEAESEEWDILSNKDSSFAGRAKVQLASIKFTHHHHYQSRDLDEKNIERLKRIFETEGCLRLDPKNHVQVLVTKEELERASKVAKTSDHLLTYPSLEFHEGALVCLHGRHRLLAASEHLNLVEQWWIVELYVDAYESFKEHIGQDFENSSNISDGEIWWHIRICNKNANYTGERKWWSRLTKSKGKDLRQLLEHSGFCQAFDQLIDIPGLWVGLQLGTLHRFLTLKCDEELLHYLHYIHLVWSGIFAGHLEKMRAADCASVQALQLCAPKSSRRDLAAIKDLMESRKLLPSIQDEQIRGEILQNILAIGQIVPSISMFFEDLIHFEELADAMKKLVGPIKKSSKNSSVYKVFRRAFTATNKRPLEVQVNETMFRSILGDSHIPMEVGYRQLWMYAMRHFPELVSARLRKENGQSKSLVKELNLKTFFEFADLADQLGFDSREIQTTRSGNPDKKMAVEYLSSVRPRESYAYDERLLEQQAARITRMLAVFKKKPNPAPLPSLTAERFPGKDFLLRRCGRPFQFDHKRDKNCLFLDNFHREYDEIQENADISSFFVTRCFYFAFYGNIIYYIPQSEIPPRPEGVLLPPEHGPGPEPVPEPYPRPELEPEPEPEPILHPPLPQPRPEAIPPQSSKAGHQSRGFDDTEMLESPEFVEIELTDQGAGYITLGQDGNAQTLVKTKHYAVRKMVDLIESGYRCIAKDGFFMDMDKATELKKTHLARPDIAKLGPSKIVKRRLRSRLEKKSLRTERTSPLQLEAPLPTPQPRAGHPFQPLAVPNSPQLEAAKVDTVKLTLSDDGASRTMPIKKIVLLKTILGYIDDGYWCVRPNGDQVTDNGVNEYLESDPPHIRLVRYE